MERQSGLSRGLGTVNLYHASFRQSPHAQSDIEGKGTRGDDRHRSGHTILSHPHDRPLAVLLLDLGHSEIDCLVLARI